MAIAHVQSLGTSGTNGATSLQSGAFASDVTGGNTVVVIIQHWKSSTPNTVSSVTDTAGNTYTQDKSQNASVGQSVIDIWRSSNVTGGSTFKVTANMAASGYITISAVEFSGLHATQPDDTASDATFDSSPTGGSLDTTTDAVVVAAWSGSGTASTTPSGYTRISSLFAGDRQFGVADYQIFTGAQSGHVPAWTLTGGNGVGASVAYKVAAGATYTLSCDPGSYSQTGTATSLEYGRKAALDPGSYTQSGVAASLERGYPLACAVGSYSLTGVAANLLYSSGFVLDPGSYTLSGTATNLEYSRLLTAAVGSYLLSGSTVSLERGYPLTLAVGSYSLSGVAVSLERGYPMVCVAGSYSLTGTAASLEYGRELAAAVGSYVLSGQTVNLTWGQLGDYVLTITPGSYTMSGQSVTLIYVSLAVPPPIVDFTLDFKHARNISLNFIHTRNVVMSL